MATQRPLFPSLFLQGCGSEHNTLCGSCLAPWDVGMSLQLILSVQKRSSQT